MRVQVALNLDLAGVEDFVTERLGKEVEFITKKNSTQFFCHLKAFLGFLNERILDLDLVHIFRFAFTSFKRHPCTPLSLSSWCIFKEKLLSVSYSLAHDENKAFSYYCTEK
jgi:hypothetical protein